MKRLTGRAAIEAWPERLVEVQAEPSDENLQRLCSLLDAVDAWVVQRWEKPGHDDRMTTFANMRAEAREANRSVSLSIRAKQAEVGRANGARKSQDRAVPSPAPLSADEGGNGTDPNTFFVARGDLAATTAAKAICRDCPVRVDCLLAGLHNREEFGIWGGAGEPTRRALRRLKPDHYGFDPECRCNETSQ